MIDGFIFITSYYLDRRPSDNSDMLVSPQYYLQYLRLKNLNLASFYWEPKIVKSIKEEIVSSFVQGLTFDAKLISICILNRLCQNPSHKFLYSILCWEYHI